MRTKDDVDPETIHITRGEREENLDAPVEPKAPDPPIVTTSIPTSQGAAPALEGGGNGEDRHRQETRERLERVKEDLGRYAVAYEASRAESMNRPQKVELEEKVRVMKELQAALDPEEEKEVHDVSESDEGGLEWQVIKKLL